MIASLAEELVKIINQLRGVKNMFKYQTTFANQLFLLYCLSGKIFFTDKIHKSFKYIWLFYHMGSLLIGYVVVGMFLLYDTKRDILMQLYLLNVTANSTFMGMLLPLILHHYRDNIEQTIQSIDDILRKEPSSADVYNKLKLGRNVVLHVVITVFCGIAFSSICMFDVIFFYEDEKVQNYAYYLFPFTHTEQYGTLKIFLIVTMFSFSILLVLCLEALAILAFFLMWNAICHSELLCIRDELNHHSDMLVLAMENKTTHTITRRIEYRFRRIFSRQVIKFQQIMGLISKSRVIYELFCSIGIPVTVIGVIVQFYSAASEELPYAVKFKGIWNTLAVGYPTFLFCWIGETMENSIAEVALSIYSTPWYCSVNIRKDVCIFLGQSQNNFNFKATKMVPLLLRSFARISHFVLSTVNFLRQLSIKMR